MTLKVHDCVRFTHQGMEDLWPDHGVGYDDRKRCLNNLGTIVDIDNDFRTVFTIQVRWDHNQRTNWYRLFDLQPALRVHIAGNELRLERES